MKKLCFATVLYDLNGFNLKDMPLGYDGLDSFCFTADDSPNAEENPAFHYAFSQSGREILRFAKSKPELSLEIKGRPAIQFYYQDEDTINFYSEPYSCYIALTEEEKETVRRLLTASKAEEGITTSQEASKFLSKKGNICSAAGNTDSPAARMSRQSTLPARTAGLCAYLFLLIPAIPWLMKDGADLHMENRQIWRLSSMRQ